MSNLLTRNRFLRGTLRLHERGADQDPAAVSDEDLMRLVADGDGEAFDELYVRYRDRLRKLNLRERQRLHWEKRQIIRNQRMV